MSQTFKRHIENFTCGHCGERVKGNGYTNHCPACLWSKHVDIHPGDRAASCGGLMEPVDLTIHGDEYDIVHRCIVCKYEHTTKSVPGDDHDELIRLAAETSGTTR